MSINQFANISGHVFYSCRPSFWCLTCVLRVAYFTHGAKRRIVCYDHFYPWKHVCVLETGNNAVYKKCLISSIWSNVKDSEYQQWICFFFNPFDPEIDNRMILISLKNNSIDFKCTMNTHVLFYSKKDWYLTKPDTSCCNQLKSRTL